MGDKKKIGVRVDESLWNRFREHVRDRRGRVRGVLGEELEKAMEQRMNGGEADPRLQRMEDDLAFVKRRLAEADTDGAGDAPAVSDAEVRPRADSADRADDTDDDRPDFVADAPDEKPARNQPRGLKADWLAAEVDRRVAAGEPGSGKIAPDGVVKHVQAVYGFDDGVAEDMAEMVLERIPHEPAPPTAEDGAVCWGSMADELWDEFEDEQDDSDESDDVWSEMDDAERGRR